MASSILLKAICVVVLLPLCNAIFVTSEFGQKSQFGSTTQGNINKIVTIFTRSSLNCACLCVKFEQCDSSVFCSGSCSLYKTRSNKIEEDLISGNTSCTYTIFPVRMVCGVHGERIGNLCVCHDGWTGVFCNSQDNLWTRRYHTLPNDHEMRAALNATIQNGARVSILEDKSGRKTLYHPLILNASDYIYAQTIFETPKDGETFMADSVAINKILQLDDVHTVNHISKTVSSRKASLTWFTKKFTTNQPCLIVADGSNVLGSSGECLPAILNGAELFVVFDGRVSSVTILYDHSTQFLALIFPMQIRMFSNGTTLLPDLPLRWEFIGGPLFQPIVEKYQFLMNGEGFYRHENIVVSKMAFFVDPSWYEAYSFVNGQVTHGTFANLKNATLSGKRVRIKFDEKSSSEIFFVNAEHIYLTQHTGIYYMLQPCTLGYIHESTISEVRTDGKYAHCIVDMKSLQVQSFNEQRNADMSWYVEDRSWHRVLHVGADGTILDGLAINLKNLILKGVRIRVILVISADVYRVMDVNQAEMTDENDMMFSAGPFTATTDQTCLLISYLIGRNSSLSTIQSRKWSLVNPSYTNESFNAETIWFVDEPIDAH